MTLKHSSLCEKSDKVRKQIRNPRSVMKETRQDIFLALLVVLTSFNLGHM